MKGIYLGIGDILQVIEKNSNDVNELVRLQCVEQPGCKGCYFRPVDCEMLVCSRYDRFDNKPVIFTRIYGEGGVK